MMAWIGIVVLVLGLLSIPLGLPGLWIMIGVAAVGAITGEIGTLTLLACVLLAIIAEIIEFVLVRRLTKQYGGSKKAFWGAIGGGFVGVLIGTPIPIIGSIIMGMVGAFVGAALVTYAETKELGSAQRVGWGAVMGRLFTTVAKTAAGVAILVLAAAALLR
jgi:uncharacterized protein